MKQLLNKFKDKFAGGVTETPQVSHRATMLNDVIRQRRNARPARDIQVEDKPADDPRIAFIQERNQIVANDDPYNSSDFDRADSWKNGGHR